MVGSPPCSTPCNHSHKMVTVSDAPAPFEHPRCRPPLRSRCCVQTGCHNNDYHKAVTAGSSPCSWYNTPHLHLKLSPPPGDMVRHVDAAPEGVSSAGQQKNRAAYLGLHQRRCTHDALCTLLPAACPDSTSLLISWMHHLLKLLIMTGTMHVSPSARARWAVGTKDCCCKALTR